MDSEFDRRAEEDAERSSGASCERMPRADFGEGVGMGIGLEVPALRVLLLSRELRPAAPIPWRRGEAVIVVFVVVVAAVVAA